MLLSTALGLNQQQPLLDFVDIDLGLDFPLYIDPVGFLNPRDDFAQRCQDEIRDFFQSVLDQIVKGRSAKGTELLEGLREPNETHLGLTDGPPNGRGIGPKQARQILQSIQSSPAAKSGILRDLTDWALFIDGIGPDKISDMTTNIIRRHLIEYTQQQFEFLGQKIPTEVPAGLLWGTGEGRWITDEYHKIPVVNDQKILLVPKRYVRWRGVIQQAARRYYTHFVTNFIRDEQLATNGRLVEVIKTKKTTKKVVRKGKIKQEFPNTKQFLAEFSSQHPAEYRKFRAVLDRHDAIGIRAIMEAKGGKFEEAAFDRKLIASLRALPTGRRRASDYHHLIGGILTYLFYPDLISPNLEREIDDGRKRIDITFLNSAEGGFFADRKVDPFTVAREVTVECKNYEDDIANPEIDQLNGRFDPRRGRLGLMLCRTITDASLVIRRCRDVFQAQRGMILVLSDDDICGFLQISPLDRRAAIQALLRGKLRDISS